MDREVWVYSPLQFQNGCVSLVSESVPQVKRGCVKCHCETSNSIALFIAINKTLSKVKHYNVTCHNFI